MTLTTALKRHLLAPAVLMLSMLLTGNVFAQEAPDNSASDPNQLEVNLKEVVTFNWGFQGATQGAGTPNQAGLPEKSDSQIPPPYSLPTARLIRSTSHSPRRSSCAVK